MNRISEVDCLDKLPTQEQIDTSDIAEITSEDVANAEIRWPENMAETVIVDSVILEWFKRHTDDYHDTINRLLREYMQSHT